MASIEVSSVEKIIVDNNPVYRFHLILEGNPYGTIDVLTGEIDENTANDPSMYNMIIRRFIYRRKP